MLKLENIGYRVQDELGEKQILKNINLTLDERFVAFTGPNGGGKSTLAKVIAGILTPTEGRIYLDGEDITDLSITERAKKGISYAFQQPVRFKGLTVRDLINIAAGKTLKVSDACAYLSEVGMCARDYIDREVNASLSGGELKRIEIATILARSTKLSVFDEPEAGIDLWSFGNLIKVFENMHEKTPSARFKQIALFFFFLQIKSEIVISFNVLCYLSFRSCYKLIGDKRDIKCVSFIYRYLFTAVGQRKYVFSVKLCARTETNNKRISIKNALFLVYKGCAVF